MKILVGLFIYLAMFYWVLSGVLTILLGKLRIPEAELDGLVLHVMKEFGMTRGKAKLALNIILFGFGFVIIPLVLVNKVRKALFGDK